MSRYAVALTLGLTLFLPLVVFGQPNLIYRDGFEAGFVVAARVNPREINIYRIDQPNVPIQTIPNARFTSGDGIFDHAGNRIGTHWSNGVLGNQYPTQLGIFTTSRPVVVGSATGHEYEYLGYIGSASPRVFFRDVTSPTIAGSPSLIMAIRSTNLDGTDSRELLGGCLYLDGFVSSAAGVVARCDRQDGAGAKSYYSDGVSPAIELPGVGTREPKAITVTRAVFHDFVTSPPTLLAQQLVAPFTEYNLVPGSGADSPEIHVNPKGTVWTRSFASGVTSVWTIELENTTDGVPAPRGRFSSAGVPLFEAMSVDGSRFAGIYQQQAGAGMADRAWILPFEGIAVLADVTPPSAPTTVRDIDFLENGKILVTRGTSLNPTGIFLHNANGSSASSVGGGGLKVLGLRGDYALFGAVISSGVLESVDLTLSGADWTLETAAATPAPSFVSPPGATPQYVTYVNDLNQAWIATLDPTIKKRIDLQATNLVSKVSEGIGNRVFLVLRREEGATDQDDIVMVDLDTLVTTPIVSGPTSDWGLYFPN